MRYFNIPASKQVGIIKNAIKDAILDGIIPNDYQKCKEFMIMKGQELGLIS